MSINKNNASQIVFLRQLLEQFKTNPRAALLDTIARFGLNRHTSEVGAKAAITLHLRKLEAE